MIIWQVRVRTNVLNNSAAVRSLRTFMRSNVFRIKMLYHPFFIEDADQLLVHLQAAVKEKLVDFSQKIVS